MSDFNPEAVRQMSLANRGELANRIQSRVASGDATVTDDEINFALETFHEMNPRTSQPPKRKGKEPVEMDLTEL